MTSSIFTNNMVTLLFNLRSSMTKGFRSNFSSIFKGDMRCKLNCKDLEAVDSQNHLLECGELLEKLTPQDLITAEGVEYHDIFGTLELQGKAVLVLARMLELREETLERQRLPVGQNTGPDSAITNS